MSKKMSKRPPMNPRVIGRVLKLLFKSYPVLVPIAIVCILISAITAAAPALFMHNDMIYMLTSACTGWKPNLGGYSSSVALDTPWAKIAPFGDDTTYHSQPTSVLTLEVGGKKQYVYIGDRWGGNQWDGKNLNDFYYENSTYYFSLVEIDDAGNLTLKECDEFTIDLTDAGFKIIK